MAQDPDGSNRLAATAARVRNEIMEAGPVKSTVEDLLRRFGELSPSLEARVRVHSALALQYVKTKPMLTAVGVRSQSSVVVSLDLERSPSRDRAAEAVAAWATQRADCVKTLSRGGQLGFRDQGKPVYRALDALRYTLGRAGDLRYRDSVGKAQHRVDLEAVAVHLLTPGEHFVASGYTNDHGVLVVTSERLLTLRSEGRWDAAALNEISNVTLAKWLFSGTVSYRVATGKATVKRFTIHPLEEAIVFAEALKKRSASAREHERTDPVAHVRNDASTLDALRQLGELHAAGILTDEEFARKKADLLKRI